MKLLGRTPVHGPLFLLTQIAPKQVSTTRVTEIVGDQEVPLTRPTFIITVTGSKPIQDTDLLTQNEP